MKKFVLTTLAVLISAALSAQVYTEASDLTLIGKIIDTPNPYHRVDTVRYKGFTKGENLQVRCPAGLAVLFRTDSPSITVQAEGDFTYQANNTMRLASHGFDLYIRKDGEWLWAAACCPAPRNPQAPMDLIKNMAPGVKECLLYLPIYSELTSVKIGVEEGRMLQPMESRASRCSPWAAAATARCSRTSPPSWRMSMPTPSCSTPSPTRMRK